MNACKSSNGNHREKSFCATTKSHFLINPIDFCLKFDDLSMKEDNKIVFSEEIYADFLYCGFSKKFLSNFDVHECS